MSKWIWCGVVGVAFAVGMGSLRHYARVRAVAAVTAIATPATCQVPSVDQTPETPGPVVQLPPGPIVQELDEPIITLSEPTETPVSSPAPLLATAGLREASVTLVSAPHPDPEARRMPYADERGLRGARAFFDWSALVEFLVDSTARQETFTEESAEPPMLDPPTSFHHHPVFCPHSGHCPYPYSTPRSMPR